MTTLVAMSEEDFGRFRDHGLAHFADLWPSLEIAQREFDKAFPEGWRTPGQHLISLADADGTVVGYLSLKVIDRAIGPEAFLLDFGVYPEYRRRGHALRALQALEPYVRQLGLAILSLSVQDHNGAANALYAQAGFVPTFVRMTKKLTLAAACSFLLAGCATTHPSSLPRKKIAIVAGIPSPAKYTVIGHARGFAFSDLEEEARARGGDAISEPATVSQRGLLESDVLKKK